jgi:hypothetical protein
MTRRRFAQTWLNLRESADGAARSVTLVGRLASQVSRPLDVIDLGAGTGANLRYLAPRLGGSQRWTLVDNDASLLSAAAARFGEAGAWGDRASPTVRRSKDRLELSGAGFDCVVSSRCLDLARGLDQLELPEGGLVTASALLDLVSETWLEQLVKRCHAARATVAFALTFDGRLQCRPPEPEDARVGELVRHHQSRDKGFGPALGPAAASAAIRLLEAHGYRVEQAQSDWKLGPGDRKLQRALLEGWHCAAAEAAPEIHQALREWQACRYRHVRRGTSELDVGHVDLIGCLKNTT